MCVERHGIQLCSSSQPSLPPCRELLKVELKPDARQKQLETESSRLMENLTSPEVHSVHGFVTVYAFLCRYYGIPFREDVAWVSRGVRACVRACGACACVWCVCMCACVHVCLWCVSVCAFMRTCENHSLLFSPNVRCECENLQWVVAHRIPTYVPDARTNGQHANTGMPISQTAPSWKLLVVYLSTVCAVQNISEIYLSHGFRVLKLNDFEQHNQR